jgi:hypothetical protein
METTIQEKEREEMEKIEKQPRERSPVQQWVSWESFNEQYSAGYYGKLGKWKIFTTLYDGCAAKGQDEKILLTCRLPGIKHKIGHYREEADARVKAEKILGYWLDLASLKTS